MSRVDQREDALMCWISGDMKNASRLLKQMKPIDVLRVCASYVEWFKNSGHCGTAPDALIEMVEYIEMYGGPYE